MSRCFPYPPPGYTRSRNSESALIELIKLQKERDKAQKKKEKKRERKEKRKGKKDKDQKSHKTEGQIKETIWADSKSKTLDEDAKSEAEERSSLTEEHGEPVTLCVPSSSSDGAETSNKRKRPLSPTECPRVTGKILKIRLTSRKQDELASLANPADPCSTCGRTTETFHSRNSRDLDVRNHVEDPPCTSAEAGRVGEIPHHDTEGRQISSSPLQIGKKPVAAAPAPAPAPWKAWLQYKDVTEKWDIPPLNDLPVRSDGMDWLLQSEKQQSSGPKKRQKQATDNRIEPLCSRSAASWPCAQLLPEMGFYALPYTIPF